MTPQMKQTGTGLLLLFLILAFSFSVKAQGVPAKAFTNVTLHKANGNAIKDAVVVWRDGVIEAAGKNKEVPFDAKVWDGGDSLHVYPGFMDGQAYWGSPDRKEFEDTPKRRGEPSYERAGIRPERHANDVVDQDSDMFENAMKAGFTTAVLGIDGYMIPGQLDLFFLQPELQIGDLYREGVGMQMQFQESYRVYPSTVMGIMAELNQLMLNAKALKQAQQYYESKPTKMAPPKKNPVLEALYPIMEKEQRVFFKADSKEMIQRIFTLQDDLGFDWVLVSGMEAYKVADELNERNVPVLAAIDFPEKPDWKKDDYEEKEDLTEEDQAFRDKRWNAYLERYKNIKTLMDADVDVGFATAGLELKEIGDKVQQWKEYGDVSDDDMLATMTVNTATILGVGQTLGNLNNGQVASFSVMTKPFTDKETKTLYSVSAGELNELEN
jgi:hypothetical protein